jgi:hypothetical protein
LGARNSKDRNRIAKIGHGHLWPREENLSFNNNYKYLLFISIYYWVDASAGRLLVPEGIIHPVFSVSALTGRYLI